MFIVPIAILVVCTYLYIQKLFFITGGCEWNQLFWKSINSFFGYGTGTAQYRTNKVVTVFLIWYHTLRYFPVTYIPKFFLFCIFVCTYIHTNVHTYERKYVRTYVWTKICTLLVHGTVGLVPYCRVPSTQYHIQKYKWKIPVVFFGYGSVYVVPYGTEPSIQYHIQKIWLDFFIFIFGYGTGTYRYHIQK